jgi:hypothetical protein
MIYGLEVPAAATNRREWSLADGKIARWIGAASSDSPAPTIDVSAKNGPLIDFAGGEAGPPANASSQLAASSSTPAPGSSPAPVTRVVQKSGGGNGVGIAALIVAILAALLAAAAFARGRRREATA